MKRIVHLILISLGILVFIFLSASAQDTYKIGAAFALSGSIAVYGEGFKKAIDLAVEEINTAGGGKGKRKGSG